MISRKSAKNLQEKVPNPSIGEEGPSQESTTSLNPDSVSGDENTIDNNVAFEAFKFSNKFLCSKAKIPSEDLTALTAGDYISNIAAKNPQEKLNLMSDIFKNITTVPKREDGFEQYIERRNGLAFIKGGIGDYIIEVVKKQHYGISDPSCASDNEQAISNGKYLLYLKGPVGCYKNRLLEYVYLTLCADEKLKDVPIFYINFTKYEGNTTLIEEDIKSISDILNNNRESKPLFILEGIRGFYFGQNANIYNPYVEFLRNRSCKIIASRDIDFTRLTSRKYELPFGSRENYPNRLSITSLNINRKDESKDFIKNCVKLFKPDGVNLKDGRLNSFFNNNQFKVDDFYRELKKLSIYTLDAYQLKLILQKMASTREPLKILDVYQNRNFNHDIFLKAYDYEYKRDFSINTDQQNDWYNIIKHKDLLDYCISRYYCTLLYQELDKDETNRKYNLPNVPFPKSVTRFIVPEFYKHTRLVGYVEKSFEQNKDKISENIGQLVQLFYLCGRASDTEQAKTTLNAIKTQLPKLSEYTNIKAGMAFLLRTLYVSLIYLGDEKAPQEYFNELLKGEDNIHVKTNIGFHLDYYGDTKKAFIGSNLPDYSEISLDKCLNTLRALTIDLSQDLENPHRRLVSILQLITYCQILERRDFKLRGIGAQSEDFLGDLCAWLQTITDKQLFENMAEVQSYFQEILQSVKDKLNLVNKQQLIKRLNLEKQEPTKVRKYNTYSQLYTIGRTGWINRRIRGGYKKTGDEWKKSVYIAESVAEHTLNSWLLGYIFLPEDNNKQQILELLLVHDFAEVCTGDIVQKNDTQRKEEERYMKDFLGERKAVYKAWCDVWGSTGKGNHLKVARDIDRIQAVYQYFRYYCETKTRKQVIENDEQIVQGWLGELNKLETDPGKNIAKCVILCNAVFLEQSELIDKFSAVLTKMFPSDSRQ